MFKRVNNLFSADGHNVVADFEETRDVQRQDRVSSVSSHARQSEQVITRKFDIFMRKLSSQTRHNAHRQASGISAQSVHNQATLDNLHEQYRTAQERYSWIRRSLDRVEAQTHSRTHHDPANNTIVARVQDSYHEMKVAYANLIALGTSSGQSAIGTQQATQAMLSLDQRLHETHRLSEAALKNMLHVISRRRVGKSAVDLPLVVTSVNTNTTHGHKVSLSDAHNQAAQTLASIVTGLHRLYLSEQSVMAHLGKDPSSHSSGTMRLKEVRDRIAAKEGQLYRLHEETGPFNDSHLPPTFLHSLDKELTPGLREIEHLTRPELEIISVDIGSNMSKAKRAIGSIEQHWEKQHLQVPSHDQHTITQMRNRLMHQRTLLRRISALSHRNHMSVPHNSRNPPPVYLSSYEPIPSQEAFVSRNGSQSSTGTV